MTRTENARFIESLEAQWEDADAEVVSAQIDYQAWKLRHSAEGDRLYARLLVLEAKREVIGDELARLRAEEVAHADHQ